MLSTSLTETMKNRRSAEEALAMEIDQDSAVADRFWAKVDKRGPDECWEWKAVKNIGGYGRFALPRGVRRQKWIVAHRVSWALDGRALPEGYILCHRCDNPGCVNPGHLFVGTHKDNARDRDSKGRRRPPVGTRNGMARLTEQQVRDIHDGASQSVPVKELSMRFGVSETQITRIVRGQSWSHV